VDRNILLVNDGRFHPSRIQKVDDVENIFAVGTVVYIPRIVNGRLPLGILDGPLRTVMDQVKCLNTFQFLAAMLSLSFSLA